MENPGGVIRVGAKDAGCSRSQKTGAPTKCGSIPPLHRKSVACKIGPDFNAMKDGLYAPDWGEEEPGSISRTDVE